MSPVRPLAGARAALRDLRRPSLLRRLLLTLLGTVLASFAVLIATDWVGLVAGGARSHAVVAEARALARSLPGALPGTSPDDAGAQAVVQAADRRLRQLREAAGWPMGPVLVRLDRLDPPAAARLLLANDPALAAAAVPAPGQAEHFDLTLAGQRYWASVHEAGPWRVWLLDPQPGHALIVRTLALDLLPSYLIAVPLVMLPLIWAAVTGLRPLRRLAQALRQRRPDDTTPLGVDTPYAELAPLTRALDALSARTREALTRERRFVQDAAHELRTPLAVIATRAHALAHGQDTAERARELAAIELAVARTSHLGQQLLTLAVLDDPHTAPATPQQTVDLVALARQVLTDALPRADARHIDLGLDSPEILPRQVELAALQSVLENLVGNAIAHGRDGGQVALTLAAHGHHGWTLSVADDGPGIPVEERERLFERFQRGRHTVARGSGLGLAIVQAAMTRLGAQLQVGDGLDGRGVRLEVTRRS